MNRNRVVVLADGRAVDSPIYRSWTDRLSLPCSYVSDFDITWRPPDDTGLIVTAQQYQQPTAPLLFEAVKNNIPVLVIADGILEYRNTWANPGIVPGSLFQPVVGHKIATLGHSQARILESWGNPGKCEIVGSPRLDSLIGFKPNPTRPDEFRVLVLTARTPGFTDDQVAAIRQSLLDLKEWIGEHSTVEGRDLSATWRLTGGMDKDIGVSNEMGESVETGLSELIEEADAVITTPSTTILEGMLCGKPVALLDYTNSPPYVPSAWSITAPDHFDAAVPELANPRAARMLYQNTVLHDALECRTPATPRMVELAERMVEIAADCRSNGRPVEFPARVLQPANANSVLPGEALDLEKLYPDARKRDPAALRVNNEHLFKLAKHQQKYINDLLDHITWITRQVRDKSPVYAKILKLISHPQKPKLEHLEKE